MNNKLYRRGFLKSTGAAALAFPALSNWAGLNWMAPEEEAGVPKRLVIMFSPNGMVTDGYWPKTEGPDFEMDSILKSLEPFREQTLLVHGVCNKIRGDGDGHMRGMSCLLTGNELFPGNIQGGSDSPAGWCKGISIDQEIKNKLQSTDETKTRFGALEFGVRVSDSANPWTRMCYAGPNQPVAPISNPYQMFDKMYAQTKDRENLLSVLDDVEKEIERSKSVVDARDLKLLNSHKKFVEQTGQDLKRATQKYFVDPHQLPNNVIDTNDNMPELSRMQIDLLVNGFANDLNRVATLQYTKSVGGARMRWLGIDQGHHSLSHDPDHKVESQDKLRRINTWYAEEMAYLCKKLKETKEPGTDRSMLDNTLVVWTNELGHGNSHTLNNLPMLMVGGGFGFEMGRFVKVKDVSTTRLWLAIAHAMGHKIESFGLAELCKEGPIKL